MIYRLFRKRIDAIASKIAIAQCEAIISEMGAEIHDDLIQRLSVLKLRIDKLQLEHGNVDSINTSIQQLQYDYKSITDSVRRISKRLHPARTDGETFDKTVMEICRNMEEAGSVRISVYVTGEARKLDNQPEIYLLRMIQELIHNSLKHSAAWHLWIRIIWHRDRLIIEVEDDGTGFARLDEFIFLLKSKKNTLRMRAIAIGANIQYKRGKAGLLASITYEEQRKPKEFHF